MTIEAKSEYTAETAKLQEKYKVEMKKWEESMIQAGHCDLLKSNYKFKRNIDADKQDSECPNQSSIQNVELTAADFIGIKSQNKGNIKTGWDMDTHYISEIISNVGDGNDNVFSTERNISYDETILLKQFSNIYSQIDNTDLQVA